MSKHYTVAWTENANDTYLDTLAFILKKWTTKEAKHFETLTKDLMEKLTHNLKLCPKVKGQTFRKCVISSQTSLVYRTRSKSVELIAFIDNRSNHGY
ncbi:MAG: plasmid stabilization system protein ParE [Crocinitomicaceae bacterium]|jgi:plasmid stabilization system protein ParE